MAHLVVYHRVPLWDLCNLHHTLYIPKNKGTGKVYNSTETL